MKTKLTVVLLVSLFNVTALSVIVIGHPGGENQKSTLNFSKSELSIEKARLMADSRTKALELLKQAVVENNKFQLTLMEIIEKLFYENQGE